MSNENIDKIINAFLKDFNEMCKTKKRDFLIREKIVNYESGTYSKKQVKYNVTYKVSRKKNIWVIEAINGFWFFKKKFLLLQITTKGEKLNFSGLYTHSFKDFEKSLLEDKLKIYLNTCKKIRHDAFVKS
ncbi:hypothetical protein J2Q11_11525 [Tenacibaculum finnmarkense genomovar finnmarkense]|uniref:Uncharacterized protein n=1 Tax=Tenacibaculum finnmarkense genomovar ulcerans TaxID=2781388 RepID=A0A2I2MB80_9FLAO|nr:hypothetical protein [Tenacibaculum finnmarkense]ALU75111.1 hypothetical protein AUW17_07490 [Tenacibaculum dicentrarchi]MBE7633753.1 hypothetical protein [Tenacibaculum finnmarkense genomovar ulcerans]MBE7645881.1 hypothetical protein [Tenacibaculum finnmarkense genomovar ulcerans]MBE7647942.1 hypothetical protein [Tenacibaculum finnmarkense genomovar ulcerans]MBE7688227.1 hypothetical protein [Tenacibaculum finnmarkense genomovar ulcerans]